MKFLNFFALAIGLLWNAAPQAELVAIQEAIEAHDIKVMMSSGGDGYVLARSCPTCAFVRLELDRNSAITVDGKPVRAGKKIEKHWSGGLVIYDIKTKHIVRLKL